MNELIRVDALCSITKTGLTFKRDVTKEEWKEVFSSLKQIEGCVQFWIGDCLAYRQQKWGMYDDVIEETGYNERTLRLAKSTSERVESGRRLPDLSFSHHVEVSSLTPEKQNEFLNMAIEKKLSVRDLREEIRKDGVVFDSSVKLPEGKFQVIYADPPWMYGNSMPNYVTTPTDYYPQMKLEDICNMPIRDIADTNAVLFLWVTSPILEESFQVIKAWGFKYKTSFIWDKIKHNMGHYSSVRHEILLLCIKGSYPLQNKKLYDSVLSLERTEHSKKPDYYYEMIEDLYPNSNKIELFSRNERKGWRVYGNQL